MRSEAEKTQDMILHEKRYRAKEIIDVLKAWKRKALIACAICAVAVFAALISFVMAAYDAQNLLLAAAFVAAWILSMVIAYFVMGSVSALGLVPFKKGMSLMTKWNDATAYFDAMENKVAERTAMPGDMEKAENNLISVADALASFAEKYSL